VNVGLDPSKVVITKLKMDKDRKAILERKSVSRCTSLCGRMQREHEGNRCWQ
jgi:hypothetical protein